VWIAVGLLIGTILNWYIVSARLRKYTIVAGNSLTIPSFFQNRYRDKRGIIKIVSAIIIAVFFTVYTASAFSSGAKLFATLFSDGNAETGNYNTIYMVGLCIAALVILVYTFMGGFKAVCTTDLIRACLCSLQLCLFDSRICYSYFQNRILGRTRFKRRFKPDNFLNFLKNDDGTPISAVSIISNLHGDSATSVCLTFL
jgi:sodium/proline symporter